MVLVLLLGVWWLRARDAQPVLVEVAEARHRAITASFTADGIIKGKSVDLAPQVAGRVQALPVVEGQAVRAGQLLARLDDREWRAAAREADEAARTARALFAQAEAALALTQRQTAAREAEADAQLAAARARLQQVLSGARSQEVAQSRHQVDVARATLTAAEHSVRRARELHAMGGLARADLDEAEARYQVALAQYEAAVAALELLEAGARPEERVAAQAQVDTALAQVKAARAARLEVELRRADVEAARARAAQASAAAERARAMLAGTVIRAPFDGVVSRVWVEVGHMASPAVPLLTLIDPGDLWISADIADEDAAKVHPGQDVIVTAPALPGRRLPGRVTEVAAQAEPQADVAIRTRVMRVKVRLLEGTGLLRPGLEVDVEGEATVVASALVVPSDALVLTDTGVAVFVVEGPVARQRQVRTGYTTFELTEILSGIDAGALVVVKRKDGLRDGQRVRIVRGNGDWPWR